MLSEDHHLEARESQDEDEQPPPNPSEPSEDAVRVAPKKKVIRNPQPKLNAQRLTGPRGIQCIEQYFKDVKFKGKGHELADLNTIMSNLEHWANRLYPKSNFVDVLKRLEVLGHKRPVMTHIKKIRLGMIEELNQDSNLVLSDTETPAQPQQPTSDDIFNDLLASQPSQHITPVVKEITEAQRERMLRNRQIAEEKRLARLAMEAEQKKRELENAKTLENIEFQNALMESEGHSSFICEQDSAPLVVRPVYMISGIREPPHAVFSAETWHHCWSVAGQTNLDESSASSSCRNSDTSHLPEAVL
ncbi:hypothetical protein M8J75_004433 [Diaphorina citri]|nr:hypothetical protein M8J75_004433 [Diaphorina citri]